MLDQFRRILNRLPYVWKRLIIVAVDIVLLSGVLWLAYQLRLGMAFRPSETQILLMALAPAIAVPVFVRMGLYRQVIRYLPERAIWDIVKAMAIATLSWVFALFLAEVTRVGILPRTIPIFYFLMGIVVIAGSRYAAKLILRSRDPQPPEEGGILIYGAGQAGRQLAAALRAHRAGVVVGFIDDDITLHDREVEGIRVYPPAGIAALVANSNVREIIVSLQARDPQRQQEIISELARHPVKLRVLPSIGEIAAGKYVVSQLRQIDIDDLLGRSAIPADPDLLKQMIAGRVILVSGAGGSIGSELCRIIARWKPKRLVLLEANEFALYQIERTLSANADFELRAVLGSTTNESLVRRALAGVDVVFHAAAHKHVPMLEDNVLEGVRNNVVGTHIIARLSAEMGIAHFVLISTDKAVRPTNVMGATKRWSELIVSYFGETAKGRGKQLFCAVRFGNVLGSNGSVVPLFKEQIAAGGPVTLTHEKMTRYFMSIHEAAELIIQAGALSHGGDLFLLDMGEPVSVRDLAENMIRLAGLTIRDDDHPEGDIEIAVTGTRPGEKLFEELLYDPALAKPTSQPKILRSAGGEHQRQWQFETAYAALAAALEREDVAEVRRVLFEEIERIGTEPQPKAAAVV